MAPVPMQPPAALFGGSPPGPGDSTNLDTTTDISIGVLWGTTPANVVNVLNLDPMGLNSTPSPNWLANQATGATDITFLGNGTIVDPNANNYVVPGEAAGSTIWLVLQGWTGNSTTYAGASSRTQTFPFSITLTLNSNPAQADIHTMPALDFEIPEPSAPMLSALATAAFALLRRRK